MGSLGGVAVIWVDPFYFTSFYSDVDVGTRGVVTLFGLDGIVRARRLGRVTEVGQDISRSTLMSLIQNEPTGHFVEKSMIDGVSGAIATGVCPACSWGCWSASIVKSWRWRIFEARKAGYFRFASAMTLIIVAFAGLSAWLLYRQRMISLSLRESQARAESANRLKSEFLASVSHELRTPLNGIIGYADLLRETADDEAHREYAGVIFDNSQHLLGLVNSILDMARVEAGEMKLKPEPVRVAALVAEVCATYQPIATQKGLALSGSGPQDAQLSIVSTAFALRTILNNLVHNALKFTDTGFVRVRAYLDDCDCIFEVADSGCGIDPRDQALIFERFRQADAFLTRLAGRRRARGSPCAGELAELMGGQHPRCIPRRGRAARSASSCPWRRRKPRGPSSSMTTRSTEPCRRSGWRGAVMRFVECGDGLQALEAIAHERFDAVLLDICMSGVSGLDVCRRLRASEGPDCPRIVAYTAHAVPEMLDEMHEAGFD